MIDGFFAKYHYQMQETRSNCFDKKKRNNSLLGVDTEKTELTTTFCIYLLVFVAFILGIHQPDERSCYISSIQNKCCEFLALGGVTLQGRHQSYFKVPIYGSSLLQFNNICSGIHFLNNPIWMNLVLFEKLILMLFPLQKFLKTDC